MQIMKNSMFYRWRSCDILFESNEVNFRATRDLDMVLIVEALTPEFGGEILEVYR